jgi:hypothetical protein
MPRLSLLALVGGLAIAIGYTAGAMNQADAADPPGASATAVRAAATHSGDYLPAHPYKLFVDGALVGGFKEVSGLETETSPRPLTLASGFLVDPAVLAMAETKAPHRFMVLYRDAETGAEDRLDFTGYPTRVSATSTAFDVAVIEKMELAVEAVAVRPHRTEVK